MSSRRLRLALPLAALLGLAIASFALAGGGDHGKGNGWGKDFKVDVKIDFNNDGWPFKGNGWGKVDLKGMAFAKDSRNTFHAFLTGHQEIPATHSKGTGHLELTINSDNTIAFELTYSGLANPATAAHVHFGQPFANGGISFFLCGAPAPKPACPPGNTSTPATVTGTIVAADVQAIPAQLLAAGDLVAVGEVIREGLAYANIHTGVSTGGEIRGQISGKKGKWWSSGGKDDD